MKRDVKGFTLIELLVVIAIIAILAAILFPVFAQARAKARQSTCLSNMKQLALGMLMYADDYDERFPCVYSNVTGSVDMPYAPVPVRVQPYMKNARMWQCPDQKADLFISDNRVYKQPDGTYRTLWQEVPDQAYTAEFEGVAISYALNSGMTDAFENSNMNCGCTAPPGPWPGKTQSSISSPSTKALMYEAGCMGGCSAIRGAWPDGGCWTFCTPAFRADTTARHNAGVNIAYVDGHTKWMKSSSIPAICLTLGSPNVEGSIVDSATKYTTRWGPPFWTP